MNYRPQLSLDGTWSFAPDAQNVGLTERWFERTDFGRNVEVPSPWQLYGEDMVGYTGVAWYHRSFEVPADWQGKRIVVRFDAVDYHARVWLDGVALGEHEGGYTPFEFEIEAPVGSRHQLVVRVHDPRDNSEIPHGKQGSWYTRVSGPWQPVYLEARDREYVRLVHVTPDPRRNLASVRIEIEAADGRDVTLRVLNPKGDEVAAHTGRALGGEVRYEVALPDVVLWSPEHPNLYTAVAELAGDRVEARFGMRWVEFKDGIIHLNGKPLYIRGALDQAFYPETVYRVPSEEAIENEIRLAKQMGLNLLRKHIKLEDPRYLDACDRLGMLIWEEPACFVKYTPQARDRFRDEIAGMIRRDYNHPSIIAWSLYNEEWGLEWRLWRDKDKQDHVEELFDWAKTLDSTRLICDNSGWAHVKTDINDWHRYFTAPDLLDEWREDLEICVAQSETNFVAGKQANAKGVPVIVSEFGVWGLPETSRITNWYGKRPWWFDAQWAGHTEEFKYPATAERHFERFGLQSVFGSMDALSVQCQRRMMTALKPIIEEMRKRADLAGYVVTEFTDIEWESNGWLDYFRKPKAGFEQFAWFNAELVVMLELPRHNLWSGEEVEGWFWVSNHSDRAFDGVVRWRVPGYEALSGEFPVHVGAFASGPLSTPPLVLVAPDVAGSARATLEFELLHEGNVVATNTEALTFTAKTAVSSSGMGPVFLNGGATSLASALAEQGVTLTDALSLEALAVTTTLDAPVRKHLENGGRALFIAEEGEGAPEKGLVSFRRLPRGESWDRAASIFYLKPDAFEGLPAGGLFGWEFEGVYPHHVVPISNYLQDLGGRGIELPSNQANVDPAGVLAGYFEGWLGKFGAAILEMPYEEGRLTVTTLRLLEGYGSQPVATLLLHGLLARAGKGAPTLAGR